MPRKTKAQIAREHVPHPLFEEFWEAYPRKVNRLDASIAFARLEPDHEALRVLIDAITRQKQFGCLRMKFGGDKSYIPYASTWLNNRRWEDEDEPAATPQPRRDRQTDYAASTLLSALHSNGVGHAQPPAPSRPVPLPGRDGAEGG